MTLQIDYDQLRREVGRKLGLDRSPDSWEQHEHDDVADVLRSGLRRFYWPPPLPPSNEHAKPKEPHSWSFLKPVATLALVVSQQAYDLPDNFGELLDPVFTHASASEKGPISVVSEQQIRSMLGQSAASGTPKYAAIRPKPITDGGKTAHEVIFYPTPDAADTLSYRYSITPPELSGENTYPLGGPQHSETVLESCLAAAEKTLNDEEGVHAARFLDCLAISIASDLKLVRIDDPGIWPLENPSDGLKINKAYLKRLIGRQLGYGPSESIWTHKQGQEVNLALESGLRKFYVPQVLPGEKYAHEWNFLKPLHDLTTRSGEWKYDLPDDFSMIEGPLTYAPDSTTIYPAISVVGEHQIRVMLRDQSAAGRPCKAALSLKPLDLGTAYELYLFPVPDGAYQLRFRYRANPIALGEDVTLPLGGDYHAQTIIEACLAAAELQSGAPGPHQKEFERYLASSISHDRKVNSPDTLGMNRDGSDRPVDAWLNHHDADAGLVRYGGYDESLYLL